MLEICPLYVIIDPEYCKNITALSLLEAVLAGGAKTIQLRAKKMPDAGALELAKKMSFLCREKGALFIVNDRLDIALASEAFGVHLGQDDLPLAAARAVVGPDFIIGVSTHNVEEAKQAEKDSADYIGFGAMYPTSSKKDAGNPQDPTKLEEIVRTVAIPAVAIGGIGLSNIGEIRDTGAMSAAVISAVSLSEDPKAAVRGLLEAWGF